MISLSLISVSIDKVVYGPNAAKVAYIISDCHEELTRRLLELDRGVTLLQGKGAYSGKDKQVILCACARTQIIPVKRAVQEIDQTPLSSSATPTRYWARASAYMRRADCKVRP